MDFGNFFGTLWNAILVFIEVIGVVWNWLSSPIELDIPLLSNIPLIGNWFQWSLDYSPFELLGDGILLLVVLWFVKNLVPVG